MSVELKMFSSAQAGFGNDTFGSSLKKNKNRNKFGSDINSAELSF